MQKYIFYRNKKINDHKFTLIQHKKEYICTIYESSYYRQVDKLTSRRVDKDICITCLRFAEKIIIKEN